MHQHMFLTIFNVLTFLNKYGFFKAFMTCVVKIWHARLLKIYFKR